jgi:hypothetical protein
MPEAHKAAHGSTTCFRSRLPHPLKKKTSFIPSRSQKSLGFDETSISRRRKPLTITKNRGTEETEPQTKTLPRPSASLTLPPCAHRQEQCLSNGTTIPNIKSTDMYFLKKCFAVGATANDLSTNHSTARGSHSASIIRLVLFFTIVLSLLNKNTSQNWKLILTTQIQVTGMIEIKMMRSLPSLGRKFVQKSSDPENVREIQREQNLCTLRWGALQLPSWRKWPRRRPTIQRLARPITGQLIHRVKLGPVTRPYHLRQCYSGPVGLLFNLRPRRVGPGRGQSEPAPMTAPVGRSVHRMGQMIRLFFIHLFTLR